MVLNTRKRIQVTMPSFILISFETVRFLFKDDAKTLSPNMYTLGYLLHS